MGFTLLDLFSGCGGLGLGFHQAEFETILANEINVDPATTYTQNLLSGNEERMLLGPIQSQLSNKAIDMRKPMLNDIDCIAGGPPCQGLSLAGAGNPDDPRNMLFKQYLRVVKKVKPRSILFENVPGFVNRYGLGLKKHLEKALEGMGYSLASSVVKASDYGVPQNRERFFLLGVHKSVEADEIFIPESTWTRERIEKELTVSNVIDDLNSYKEWGGYGTGEIWGPSTYTKPAKSEFAKSMRAHSDAINSTWNTKIPRHTKLVSERMRRILKGETPDDWIGTELETKKHSQRGLRKDKFEQITMVSTPDDYVHYDIELPRTLSVRECARFQTFPDHFLFHGKRTTGGERRKIDVPQYTQVANAIPPRLAETFALHLQKFIQ